jgi:hypothetical protein
MAFRGDFELIAHSMLWIIIGVGIIITGTYFGYMTGTIQNGFYGMPYYQPNWLIMALSWIVGYVMVALGFLASLFKV